MMIKKDIGMALASIRTARTRSLLTVLGVIVAVASVVIVVSIGRGIQTSVAQQTNQYSKNVITVRPAEVGSDSGLNLAGSTPRAILTDKDVENIGKIPTVRSAVPLTVVGSTAQGDKRYSGVVFAVSSDLPQAINQELSVGAFFTSKEESNNLAVLGASAAEGLFDQRVPLGRSFTIRGQQFIVSGVLERFVSTPFASASSFNNAIFVPAAAAESLAPNGAPPYEVLVRVGNDNDIAKTDAAISNQLARAHGSRDDFQVLSPTELAGDTTSTFNLLTDFVLIAALITLLVSGIGIMNVMLVSVAERIREIGIRKAVGATNRQILSQFVTEAATLSVVGGVIGVVLSFATVWLLRWFSPLSPTYDFRVAGLACLAAIVFGIICGAIPAVKAARKDPITALRND